MVEPAAAVRGLPVGGAVAPPAVELLGLGPERAGGIGPAELAAQLLQRRGLDRRVADDVEQLLVTPDIVLIGGDVEVADQDARPPRRVAGDAPGADGVEELQLVGEFRIGLGIGDVAAGRDVEIMDGDAGCGTGALIEHDGHVAGVIALAHRHCLLLGEGQLRDDGDAIIALVADEGLMDIARLRKGLGRELLVRRLGLLQAEDIGLMIPEELRDHPDAQAHRVDVPGGDGELHERGNPA